MSSHGIFGHGSYPEESRARGAATPLVGEIRIVDIRAVFEILFIGEFYRLVLGHQAVYLEALHLNLRTVFALDMDTEIVAFVLGEESTTDFHQGIVAQYDIVEAVNYLGLIFHTRTVTAGESNIGILVDIGHKLAQYIVRFARLQSKFGRDEPLVFAGGYHLATLGSPSLAVVVIVDSGPAVIALGKVEDLDLFFQVAEGEAAERNHGSRGRAGLGIDARHKFINLLACEFIKVGISIGKRHGDTRFGIDRTCVGHDHRRLGNEFGAVINLSLYDRTLLYRFAVDIDKGVIPAEDYALIGADNHSPCIHDSCRLHRFNLNDLVYGKIVNLNIDIAGTIARDFDYEAILGSLIDGKVEALFFPAGHAGLTIHLEDGLAHDALLILLRSFVNGNRIIGFPAQLEHIELEANRVDITRFERELGRIGHLFPCLGSIALNHQGIGPRIGVHINRSSLRDIAHIETKLIAAAFHSPTGGYFGIFVEILEIGKLHHRCLLILLNVAYVYISHTHTVFYITGLETYIIGTGGLYTELRRARAYEPVVVNVVERQKLGIHVISGLSIAQPYLEVACKRFTCSYIEFNDITLARLELYTRGNGPVVVVARAGRRNGDSRGRIVPRATAVLIFDNPFCKIVGRIQRYILQQNCLAIDIVEVDACFDRQRFYVVNRSYDTIQNHTAEFGRRIGVGIFFTDSAVFQGSHLNTVFINRDVESFDNRSFGDIERRVGPVQGYRLLFMIGRNSQTVYRLGLGFRGLRYRNLIQRNDTVGIGRRQVETYIHIARLAASQTNHFVYRPAAQIDAFGREAVGHACGSRSSTPFDNNLVGIECTGLREGVTNHVVVAGNHIQGRRDEPVVGFAYGHVAIICRTGITFFHGPFHIIGVAIDDSPAIKRLALVKLGRINFVLLGHYLYIFIYGKRLQHQSISTRSRCVMEREIVVATRCRGKDNFLYVFSYLVKVKLFDGLHLSLIGTLCKGNDIVILGSTVYRNIGCNLISYTTLESYLRREKIVIVRSHTEHNAEAARWSPSLAVIVVVGRCPIFRIIQKVDAVRHFYDNLFGSLARVIALIQFELKKET